MVDLETMGHTANAVITSIGAVRFGEKEIIDEFYYTIDLQSCIDAGMEMTVGTVIWWLNQSEAARKIYTDEYYKHAIPIDEALNAFTEWIKKSKHSPYIWGNGASFDNVILANAYERTGSQMPWRFWNDRCYRTFKAHYAGIKMDRSGVHHNALDDARSQAQHMIKIHEETGVEF